MIATSKNKSIHIPNLLLIAGNGRNVGKTTIACKIISFFASRTDVIGVKISPHQHSFNETDVLFRNEKITIIDEKQINLKDSSLMLQAGAKQVYFAIIKPEDFMDATEHLIQFLPDNLIICESGGLHEFVSPGMFLMVKRKEDKIVKNHLLQYSPIIVNNDGKNFDFDIQKLEFNDHQIKIKKLINGKV
jgi:hypothetical protein